MFGDFIELGKPLDPELEPAEPAKLDEETFDGYRFRVYRSHPIMLTIRSALTGRMYGFTPRDLINLVKSRGIDDLDETDRPPHEILFQDLPCETEGCDAISTALVATEDGIRYLCAACAASHLTMPKGLHPNVCPNCGCLFKD